jgi:hypothetical protein
LLAFDSNTTKGGGRKGMQANANENDETTKDDRDGKDKKEEVTMYPYVVGVANRGYARTERGEKAVCGRK